MHVGRQYRHKQTWLPLALAPNFRDEERVGKHGLKAYGPMLFKQLIIFPANKTRVNHGVGRTLTCFALKGRPLCLLLSALFLPTA